MIIEYVIVSTAIGIILSRTNLIEPIKKKMLDSKIPILPKLLDCPLCSSFWSGIIIGVICSLSIKQIILVSLSSALLGYYIGKD